MDTADSAHRFPRFNSSLNLPDNAEMEELADEDEQERSGPEQRNAERILCLLHLLSVNTCTQAEIFECLRDYYPVDVEVEAAKSTTRTAYWRLRRDLIFLRNIGYELEKKRDSAGSIYYTLVKGSGPITPLLLKQGELAILATLYMLFVNADHPSAIEDQRLLSEQTFYHPFAKDILLFIERLIATLPAEQKSYFEKCVRRPLLYFNLDTVTEYLPHRATIAIIVQAIERRQQIWFEYASTPSPHTVTVHKEVDPYYLIQQDGHVYLVGYSHDGTNPRKNRVFEWRVDRIKTGSIKSQPNTIRGIYRPRPITFRYWADISIAKSGLSRRWLSHEIEREEVVDEGGQKRHRLLIRAQAYNEWRIIQQLHKYGDKVELIDPPELLKRMRQEVKRMYDLYFQSGQIEP